MLSYKIYTTLLHDRHLSNYICFAILIDQITHPWNIDDSGEPSQLPHGKLFELWLYISGHLLIFNLSFIDS
jgi:hypothetical protein